MKNHFVRGGNIIKKLGVGRSILDELMEHKIARPMNDPREKMEGEEKYSPDIAVWINPYNQTCFNAMWCDYQNLEDWMNGKGPMVKGDTDEEKKKYWDYAVAESEDTEHIMWSILYHWRWFDSFVTDFDPHKHSQNYGISSTIKNPLKLNKKNPEETIKAMFVPYVAEMSKDMEYRKWCHIRQEAEKEWYGIKRTLYCLGIGTMAACNTPEEITNLSWVTGIVESKAYYLGLLKAGKTLPDFAWLSEKIYDKYKKDKDDL